jgi:hypothetical protein
MSEPIPTKCILALDLSLRGAGAVALPLNWSGNWNVIPRQTFGEKLSRDATEQMRIGRLIRLSASIVSFAEMFDVAEVYVEQYAFTSTFGREALGELGGVVRHQMATKLGRVASAVAPASARKLLMGACPRKGAKDAARVHLHQVGMPPDWTSDEADAFVIANYAASALGGFAYVTAPPVIEKKARRKAA